jgi:hypothetical protein
MFLGALGLLAKRRRGAAVPISPTDSLPWRR